MKCKEIQLLHRYLCPFVRKTKHPQRNSLEVSQRYFHLKNKINPCRCQNETRETERETMKTYYRDDLTTAITIKADEFICPLPEHQTAYSFIRSSVSKRKSQRPGKTEFRVPTATTTPVRLNRSTLSTKRGRFQGAKKYTESPLESGGDKRRRGGRGPFET